MPTYEYRCNKDGCAFCTEEFFSIAERDRPVGSECPVEKCDGKVVRAVTTPHMQDVTHTEQQKLSRGINNPTGQFKEKMQQILLKLFGALKIRLLGKTMSIIVTQSTITVKKLLLDH